MRFRKMLLILALLPILACLLISCGEKAPDNPLLDKDAAIARLEDMREVDTAQAAIWAADPDSVIRRKTAYMIGIVGDTLYRPELLKLLNDSSRSVMTQAIFAAGQLRDSTFDENVMRFIDNHDSLLFSMSIQALGKIGSRLSICALVGLLDDTLESSWVRAEAAQSMSRLKDENSKAALIDLGRIDDNAIREKIYYSLYQRADSTMQRLFKIGLRDTLEQIQIYSVVAAGRIGDSSSIDRIAPLLRKNNWRLKYHALHAVAQMKLTPLLRAVANLLEEGEHEYVRQAAIYALGELGSKSVVSRLQRFLDDDDVNLATEALLALAKIEGARAMPAIERFAQFHDRYMRAAAAAAYGAIGDDSAVAHLERMYQDSLAFVREEVLSQIYGLESDSLTRSFTELALSDPDMVPVVLACWQVAEKRMSDLVPLMCKQYRRDFGEYSYEVKTSILDALLEFGDSLTVSPEIEEVVKSAREDDRYAIRRRAHTLAERFDLPGNFGPAHYASDITQSSYASIFEAYTANPRAVINTSRGEITIELFYQAAPKTVTNFIKLAKSGFYDHTVWHRVVPDFVIQDGCPRGDGWGGPGYEIRSEDNDLHYDLGSVGMATAGKDTGGSQYFICQSPQPHLDGRYTLFGKVIEGIRTATLIELGDSIINVQIIE
jgi:peptidyl-prolyl cis-trans isomerase B (cyclophilin B)